MIALLIAASVLFQSPLATRSRMPSVEWQLEGQWEARLLEDGGQSVLTLIVTPIGRIPAILRDGRRTQRAAGIGQDATGRVTLEFRDPATVIRGRLRIDGSAIDATVKRDGGTRPAVFHRVAASAAPARPQTPMPPYPYGNFDLSIDTGSGILAGTLTLPKGRGPFPAAVLVSGTGPDDRDASFAGHRPFFVIADYLTRRGFAVLRLDDRGAGRSSGLFGEVRTVEADAFDAVAAVRFLRAQPDIDAHRVGLIGFSEGGMVAPLAAVQEPGISFLVLLGAPAMDGGSIGVLQHAAMERARGTPEPTIQALHAVREGVYAVFRSESDAARAYERINAILDRAAIGADSATTSAIARQRAAFDMLMQRHAVVFRQRLLFDPVPSLRAVRIPVLALYGSIDVQVPPDANVSRMREAIASSSLLSRVEVLPGLNHGFQSARTGGVEEYAQLAETMAPEALNAIAAWLARVTRR